MSEPTMLQLRARITALEVFASRFIILQLHQLEAEYGRDKVVDLIDQLDQQIVETVSQVAMRKPDEQAFSREVDAHLNWLMSLLRGQFKLTGDEEE
ncbi:MAG: hypothetical protein PVI23_04070 [Maricaulaceae bacterium]|jgi:hypothetical protein